MFPDLAMDNGVDPFPAGAESNSAPMALEPLDTLGDAAEPAGEAGDGGFNASEPCGAA